MTQYFIVYQELFKKWLM